MDIVAAWRHSIVQKTYRKRKPQNGIVTVGVQERLGEGGLFLRSGMVVATGRDVCKTQALPQGNTGRR
jgi:hypothetical protein